MANPASLPPTLTGRVWPTTSGVSFPELDPSLQASSRYLPSTHPLGICISGGGNRSLSAAIGQMRGVRDLGLLDLVGAVSCVSGGSWFGTIFNFAPAAIPDSTLLGSSVAPQALTLAGVSSTPAGFLGSPLPLMTNSHLLARIAALEFDVLLGKLPESEVYPRTLNDCLLKPFSLDSTSTFFSLDSQTVAAILANNPALTASNFFTVRAGRPYYFGNSTQVFPTGEFSGDRLRHFAYSPLYTGTPQLFPDAGPNGEPFGGGWVESFLFNSQTPLSAAGDLATVNTPQALFLLSDIMGSSGAAPGSVLDEIGVKNLFTEFNYWPPTDVGQLPSAFYSIVDGGDLEDTGIVPLLWRQYPVILAFVNAEEPLGDTGDSSVQGVSGQVSRLFGLNPKSTSGNDQDTQIFPQEQFDALVQGLMATQHTGAFFADSYSIVEGNSFAIPPYPNGGKVTVVWFYNNLNQSWKSAIEDPGISSLLNGDDPANRFSNFPNYSTVFQNKVDGFPELLWLTAQQVNLMGQMWSFTVGGDAGAAAIRGALAKVS